MRKTLALLLCFWIALIVFSGCTTITLHPVTDKDIKVIDGYVCMSPEYVKEVMGVKLEAKK
jgi:hypothetical protein